VDVVDTRPDLVRVAELLEGTKQLEITLGGLNGDNISIEALDRREDVVKVGVAEVRVSLGSIGNASSGKLEGVDSPGKVAIPVDTA
jgi:hypothetical protein